MSLSYLETNMTRVRHLCALIAFGQGSERARVAFGISSYISLGNRFFDFRAGSALTVNLWGNAGKVVQSL